MAHHVQARRSRPSPRPGARTPRSLPKVPTGVAGLDELTGGGLPRGRVTLVCGGTGCGKTLLAAEFLVRGARDLGEPGVFVAFEERAKDLERNVASLGFDLPDLQRRGLLVVDHVYVDPAEIAETGEYDLGGLFIRIGQAIDKVGAKRVVLDTIESLFAGFTNHALLRAEIRRLFRWLQDRGVTTVVTGERGGGADLTRQGLEEYVSDCVIVLENRVREQLATRSLRVVKYRGSMTGTNEYPFIIDEHGFAVLPITGMALEHPASRERVSSGLPRLDAMLGGKGYYRGSSVLITGTAGTGKTTLGAHALDAACRRGERAMLFAFEESPEQVVRNLRSVGIDLGPWVRRGRLRIVATRPAAHGLEMHVARMHREVRDFAPSLVVVDPLSSLGLMGDATRVKHMGLLVLDFLKARGITTILTSLTLGEESAEMTGVGISSLTDTWLLLRNVESNGERNRLMFIIKSRGMAHSNQVVEFRLTGHGVDLQDAYIGPQGVVTGSARAVREEEDQAAALALRQEVDRLRRDLDRRHRALTAQVTGLRAEAGLQESEVKRSLAEAEARLVRASANRTAMTSARADEAGPASPRRRRVHHAAAGGGGNGHATHRSAPVRGP